MNRYEKGLKTHFNINDNDNNNKHSVISTLFGSHARINACTHAHKLNAFKIHSDVIKWTEVLFQCDINILSTVGNWLKMFIYT